MIENEEKRMKLCLFAYKLGKRPLNNSVFFPNVTVVAQSSHASSSTLPPTESIPSRAATVPCTDLEKYAPDGEMLPSEPIGLALSVVVCNLPTEFRDLVVRVCPRLTQRISLFFF